MVSSAASSSPASTASAKKTANKPIAAKQSTKPATATKPVSSIVKKPSFIVPVLIVIILAAVIALIYMIHGSDSRGPLIATVNGEPVYAADIDATLALLPAQYNTPTMRETVINQTIDKTLLIQEAKRRGIVVTDKEADTNIEVMLNDTGKGYNELDAALAERNMTRAQYRATMRDLMMIDRLGRDAIASTVSVSENEIMDYYEANQAQFLTPQGGRRISHILVKNLSEAHNIISQLNGGADFATLATKYSIDPGSASQGGALGIIKAGDPFVKPFLDAALALRENEYTRTPVESQYGYHIIYRAADLQPIGSVRVAIRSKLENEKNQAAFKKFLENLHATANIKFYTENGVVSAVKPQASLDDFATCVAGKGTVYGATWSEAFKSQQALFGDSWSKLSVVDCDNAPNVCSAANIQKYPTWIIAGKQYGTLSLKELASTTGCTLPSTVA